MIPNQSVGYCDGRNCPNERNGAKQCLTSHGRNLTGITVKVSCNKVPGCSPDTPCAECREIMEGEQMYKVTRLYAPTVNGETELHYTLMRLEAEPGMGRDTHMHFSFYIDPEGRETAGTIGYDQMGPYGNVDRSSQVFADLQRTVYAYQETH